MAKFNKKLVEQICKLVSSDSYTVDEICQQVGINRTTYFRWLRENNTFATAIKSAQQRFHENLIAEAKRSLMKKIRGYEAEEVKTVYGRKDENGGPKIKEQTRIKKHVPPDTTAIIFTLVNRAPEDWKNKQELSGKIDIEGKLTSMTDEQLNRVIDQVLSSRNEQ